MNNKILIGSIIAVTVLIGVSFTSVVGYRSGASDVKASPLFNIRSKRAIDEESEDLSCEYVGKGKESILSFPQRDNRTEIVQKIVKSINQMSDETFEKFVTLFIHQAQKDKRFNDETPNEIRKAFYLIRYNDKSIPIYDTDTKNITFGHGIKGFLSCILLPFELLYKIIVWIANAIFGIITLIVVITYFICPWNITKYCSG